MLAWLIALVRAIFSGEDPEDNPKPRVFKVDRAGNVIKPDRDVVLKAANKNPSKKKKKT